MRDPQKRFKVSRAWGRGQSQRWRVAGVLVDGEYFWAGVFSISSKYVKVL
jgi:hypothetical protein